MDSTGFKDSLEKLEKQPPEFRAQVSEFIDVLSVTMFWTTESSFVAHVA